VKFEQVLEQFTNELRMEYGIDDPLIQLKVSAKLFDRIAYDIAVNLRYSGLTFLWPMEKIILRGVELKKEAPRQGASGVYS